MKNKKLIAIEESRFVELTTKEQVLKSILERHPDVLNTKFRTTTATKKYKSALKNLVAKVEEVVKSSEFIEVFQTAYAKGLEYKGSDFAKEMQEAKKALGK